MCTSSLAFEWPKSTCCLAGPVSMLRMRDPKPSEPTVSCCWLAHGEIYEISDYVSCIYNETYTCRNMSVFESPPSESDSSHVNFEFLYGMCALFAISAETTSPSADNDLLICCVSFMRSPVAPDRLNLSELSRVSD